ncbi:MAG: choice-of-anchor D domain-containing protein [Phycisphaerae bacterium]|nr:choice-of-anchor D domain-containing protein [Phycisphaerae bacterium]
MYSKKLVIFIMFSCISFGVANSTLLADPQSSIDISEAVIGDLFINGDWDNPNSTTDYDFVNFLPGASTSGYIQINAGGEVHLYGGTFDTEFGAAFEGFVELGMAEGVLVIHGTDFWVGEEPVPQGTTTIDLNPSTTTYPAGIYGFHNVQWMHHDGTVYNIWMAADVPVNLSNEPFGGSEPENQAPVANAGGPYTASSVDGGPVAVDLTAAASTDPDGQVVAWNWDLDNDGEYETSAQIVNINSFPVGTSTVGLVVVDNLGLQSEPVTTTVTVTKLDPEIEVYPAGLTYDYGDIEVGLSETYVVQIVNSGQGNLNISAITLTGSADFQITSEPDKIDGVVVIAPDEAASTDIEITFTPSTDDTLLQATLTITSDDADEPAVSVLLSGLGVIVEIPVEQQIANTIAFFNQSVEDGTILGYAPKANPKTIANRLKAMGNMLKSAGRLIEIGETQTAITQLESIAKKTDGQKSPPDFVVGDGVAELNQRVNDLIEALSQ